LQKKKGDFMDNKKQWSKPIVIFHTLLVFSVLGMFISGKNEIMSVHELLGYFIFLLIIFRIYYSFSTKYPEEKISSWFHHPKELIHFFKTYKGHKESKYHNVASSFMILWLMFLLLANIITGSIGYAGVEAEGYFYNFIEVPHSIGKIFKDIHLILIKLLFISVILHILGSIGSSITSKTNMVKSIFTFSKNK
jgi:cytochrome b